MKNKSDKVMLTTELFEMISNDNNQQMIKLKNEQLGLVSVLIEKKEVLQNMQISYGQLRVNIKQFKKEIKAERKKLRKTNHSLCLVKKTLSKLNKLFASEKSQFIKIKKKK